MEVEMLDFSMLSLNDVKMIDVRDADLMKDGYNGILESETIDELLMKIYSYTETIK